MRFLVFLYFYLQLHFLTLRVAAQVDLYPKHFGQVMLAKQLFNPALTNMDRATSVVCSNRFFTGAFSKINNFYAIANIHLNRKDSTASCNSVGLKFANERDGEFIERSKYYASYSFRTRIHNDYWLGLGLDLGRAGYLFKGTDVSTSGSDSNWDGNMGIVLHSPNLCLAGSVNQLFSTTVLPKDLYFRWKRFYVLYAEKVFDLGTSQWSVYAQNQFLPSQRDVADLGTHFKFANGFWLGSSFWVGRSVSAIVGLKDMAIDHHHFSLYTSYNIPASSQASANIQSFEVSLQYQFK